MTKSASGLYRRPCESRDPYAVPYRFGHGGGGLFYHRTPVAMGPCFRRDDARGFDCQTTDTTSRSRGAMRPSRAFISRPKEGVGNAGCPLHPQPRVQCVGSTRVSSPRSHRDHPAFPHAMVLTASFVLSPVTGLFCHRRQRIKVLSADKTSANLTPASGRQDHTTSPSAASISRQLALRSLTGS